MKINCGENIKKFRLLNDLSQTELGDKLGVKHGAISSWENNRTEPNMPMVEKICKVLQCKKTDIIGSDFCVDEKYRRCCFRRKRKNRRGKTKATYQRF